MAMSMTNYSQYSQNYGFQQPLQTRTVNNFSHVVTGQQDGGFLDLGTEDVHGYGLDLNGDGQFERGQDGALVVDFNHDGKIGNSDVNATSDLMTVAGGSADLNHDGETSFDEAIRAKAAEQKFNELDSDHDHKLDNNELTQGDAHVWVDGDQNGQIDDGESLGTQGLPGGARIDGVDPTQGTTDLSRGGGDGWQTAGGGEGFPYQPGFPQYPGFPQFPGNQGYYPGYATSCFPQGEPVYA